MTDWPVEFLNALRDAWAWSYLHPWISAPIGISLVINNGLRTAYKEYATRPPWARFIIGATDPLCGNFWRLVNWITTKFSLPFKFPSGSDDSGTIPPAAVAAAEKRQQDAKP